MDAPIFTIIGAVSGVAGVAGLFIALPNRRSRIIHFVYGFAIASLSGTAIYYSNLSRQMSDFDRQAHSLAADARFQNPRGMMLATLALLERNKERFPETYAAAKQLCESAGFTGKTATISASEGSAAMASLLQGLSTPTGGD